MPYVTQDKREILDNVVDKMFWADVKADGDLNYILFAFCKRSITPSYTDYKNFCAELRQCATEIERRLLNSYEDRKILENGDII